MRGCEYKKLYRNSDKHNSIAPHYERYWGKSVQLPRTVRANVSIDWTVKQTARAKIRVLIKRILCRFGYPPDLQDSAANTILEHAERLAAEWTG